MWNNLKSNYQKIITLIIVVLVAIGIRLSSNPVNTFSGETMGTKYEIKIVDNLSKKKYNLVNQVITNTLYEVNKAMSTWISNSEISKFNHSTSTNNIIISPIFYDVIVNALMIAKDSNGYFDPTIQPLLDEWGFGSGSKNKEIFNKIPNNFRIKQILSNTGWEKITYSQLKYESNEYDYYMIKKDNPLVQINLGAIAKGYAVDMLKYKLTNPKFSEDFSFENIFINIGGDIFALGLNQDKLPWEIGIRFPDSNLLYNYESNYGMTFITNGSLATSGSYFNYIKDNQSIYTHIINPKNGHAIESNIVSVSVFTESATYADGLATAIFSMGIDKGLEFIESIPIAEVMIIAKDNNKNLIDYFSTNFKSKTKYKAFK